MSSENIITITKDNFSTEVLGSDIPVLIDFWASWCGPCKMIAPSVDKLADKYAGQLKVGKINTDEELALCKEYMIMSIPTLIFFKDGKPENKIVGFRPYEELEAAAGSIL